MVNGVHIMLMVKTIVKQSNIEGAGLGLFADEFIPKGTMIFQEDTFSISFTEDEFEKLSKIQKDFIHTYGYIRDGIWRCSLDNDRFTNHSDNPNCDDSVTCCETFASRDIEIGEEITTNYYVVGCPKDF